VLLQGLADRLQHEPLAAAATLFGAGVLTSLTPCIYPMIPITAAVVAGDGAERRSRSRVILLTLTYALGLALLYATMGLVAGLTGSLFGTVASNPWVMFATANLLIVFALAMLDVIPVRAPGKLLAWASSLRGGSYPAVFLLGATSGIVAAPCGAPAFATVLTFVATTGSPWLGFVYLFVFSIGMTALLIVVGAFSGALARLPRSGAWLVWIKRVAALIMIGVAEYYLIRMGMVL
jgi:thiol:disulfide interchange protein DsbD